MSDKKHTEEKSEDEENELKDCKKSKNIEESKEEDLVVQYREDSNNSIDSKKRKRSDDEDFPDPEPVDEKDFQLTEDDIEIQSEKKRIKSSSIESEEKKEDEQKVEEEKEDEQIVKEEKEEEIEEGKRGDEQKVEENKEDEQKVEEKEEDKHKEKGKAEDEQKVEEKMDDKHKEKEKTEDEQIVNKIKSEPSYSMETVVIKQEIESDADIDFEEEEAPIEKKRIKKTVFTDEALLNTQDILGIHFDYDIFGKYGVEEYEVEKIVSKLEDGQSTENPGISTKQPETNIKVFDVHEPTLLRHEYSTDMEEICATDIPERMQLRLVPVTSIVEGSNELELEAKWIYEHAFCKRTISIQDAQFSEIERERLMDKLKNGFQTIDKIKKALDLMRNQHFEVPFISFYRKEYVMPELDINDLWTVYKYDAKWCQLRERKEHLLLLFENMKKYQFSLIKKCADGSLLKGMRFMKSDDIERLRNAKTTEEVHDIYRYFKLHYNHEVEPMKKFIRCETRKEEKIEKRKKLVKEAQEKGENPPPPEDTDDEEDQKSNESVEQPQRNDPYSICRKAGLDSFIKTFGLTSDELGENMRDNYQRHEVKQEPFEPMITASQFCGGRFSAPEKILKSAQFMYAIQIACEPLVRQTVRNLYTEKAKLSVRATKKGIKEIDENHPIFTMKYLKNKPVKDLVGDQFLKLVIAEQEELITMTFGDSIEGYSTSNYIDEVKQFLFKHGFSITVKAWNTLRIVSAEMAMIKMVIPDMKKELRANLLLESKDYVIQACCRKMYGWISISPYTCHFPLGEDPAWNTSNGIRVMGVSYVPDESQPAYACIVEPNGVCSEILKLLNLLKRRNSLREVDKLMKEADLLAIRNLIASRKPHVVAVAAESRDAMMIQLEIREIVTGLFEEEQFPIIQVEICDNDLAKIYAKSKRGISEFREHCPELRQAISICRRLQDPLVEFSQLCTYNDEILSLKYHPLQDQLPEDELLENIYTEFINRVNQVGVNVNKAAQRSYSRNLLQFVCGLGPRKAQALIKVLKKQVDTKLENRSQLVTICNLGPKVFINCAGFIKIDTCSLKDIGNAYAEVLDGSRIHPENYECARKMAVDALGYDEEESENCAKALEEILSAPERLKDLDLYIFAENLRKQGFGEKRITLYDIRAELSCMYKDFREAYKSPTSEELFYILTKETRDSFYAGKVIVAKVVGISHRKPQGDHLNTVEPVRNEGTGLWECPFCFKNDFLELSEVWIHIEAICPGMATGVKLRLDNGVSGYIHIQDLSDKHVANPKERVCVNQSIYCRITKVDVEKFGVECTSRSKDLADIDNEWRPPKDAFYDKDADEKEKEQDEESKKVTTRQTYLKQIIGHPSFRNIDFAESERLMKNKQQGTVIVRPSSKGPNHLTVTWKLAEDVIQHIDVIEEGKASGFALGTKLRVGNEEFEDLDKIVAKYINPMAAFVTEVLNFKYFKPGVGAVKEKAEDILKAQKREKPSTIPYLISASRTYPGNFLLSHLPRNLCKHEYFSVIPEGFKFRTKVFVRLNDMIRWFKEPQESTQKSQNIHEKSKTIFPSQTSVSGYDGHNTYAYNPYLPIGQTLNETTTSSHSPQTAFLHPVSFQSQNNQGSDVNNPQPTENIVNKFSLTWNQQIEAKVFDDTYFTKTGKPKKVYDNGVGHGLTFPVCSKKKEFIKGEKDGDNDSWYDEPTSSKDSFDDRHFSRGSFRDPKGASRDPFDDKTYARGTSRDRMRRDRFEKISNHGSSPKNNEHFNAFRVGSDRNKPSHDYPLSPPRDSFRGSFQDRRKEREPSYHSPLLRRLRYSRSSSRGRSPIFNSKSFYRERSPAVSHHSRERSVGYSCRHSRDRSPRFSSRSSWDQSPTFRSSPPRGRSPSIFSRRPRKRSPRNNSHSRDRNPGNRYNSTSSWDRSPAYRSNHSQEKNVSFKPRHSRDVNPRFNPSPPRERSPRFSKPYRSNSLRFDLSPPRHRSPQFNPHSLQDDDPDEDNSFVMGSLGEKSRGGCGVNGNTSRESSPSFNNGPFNFRGRGRGFRAKGRGSRYEMVFPRERSTRYNSHSHNRNPGNRYNSKSSWNRDPAYRSNHSQEENVSLKPRHSRDVNPRFNPSPPRERSPRFSKPYRSSNLKFDLSPPRHRSPQFNPPSLQDDDPDEDNPFVMGYSRDKRRGGGGVNGNTCRESSPSFNNAMFNFRGRGRGFRARGRGSRYDVVFPRESIPQRMPGFNEKKSFPPVASNNSSQQENQAVNDDNPFLVGSCRDPSLKKINS